ncbi:MAG: helix-turn-helix domain-containing protein [Bifidobacteriaceae bacterium]|jgi:transcriptional regulator with XRE-family HTH domain|nr:helix-turn-helix domain-containing protein [Bifidobacteriaceae bacterium]
MTTLDEYLERHPVDRARVDAHKRRMMDEARAYRLRELREQARITQVQLAGRLGVSQNRISRIEHGDIDRSQIDTLRKYVEAVGGRLHVEVEYGQARFPVA